jgi:hypothetical protein
MNLRPLNSLYSDGPSQLGTGFSDYSNGRHRALARPTV